tara:strand:- start:470 stop:721 length:252 start_codon:yes stop_codon:yes gene_type:complete
MYSEFENKILEKLKKEFGKVHEALDEEMVMEKVRVARNLYELSVEEFRVNQSAHNYNMLILGMITLQYWNQKKVRLFNITEDF